MTKLLAWLLKVFKVEFGPWLALFIMSRGYVVTGIWYDEDGFSYPNHMRLGYEDIGISLEWYDGMNFKEGVDKSAWHVWDCIEFPTRWRIGSIEPDRLRRFR